MSRPTRLARNGEPLATGHSRSRNSGLPRFLFRVPPRRAAKNSADPWLTDYAPARRLGCGVLALLPQHFFTGEPTCHRIWMYVDLFSRSGARHWIWRFDAALRVRRRGEKGEAFSSTFLSSNHHIARRVKASTVPAFLAPQRANARRLVHLCLGVKITSRRKECSHVRIQQGK
jgi:hypothetical protein